MRKSFEDTSFSSSTEELEALQARAEAGCLTAQVALADIERGGSGISNVACLCEYCIISR